MRRVPSRRQVSATLDTRWRVRSVSAGSGAVVRELGVVVFGGVGGVVRVDAGAVGDGFGDVEDDLGVAGVVRTGVEGVRGVVELAVGVADVSGERPPPAAGISSGRSAAPSGTTGACGIAACGVLDAGSSPPSATSGVASGPIVTVKLGVRYVGVGTTNVSFAGRDAVKAAASDAGPALGVGGGAADEGVPGPAEATSHHPANTNATVMNPVMPMTRLVCRTRTSGALWDIPGDVPSGGLAPRSGER